MANQIIVTQSGNVQVSIEPTPNVQVQISRAAIGTVSNVPTANFANYAGNVIGANQPNITSLGTLTGLNVSGNGTVNNLTVTGNLSVGNLFANNANYANFANIANIANIANSVAVANVSGIGNIATINLDGNVANLLTGNGTFVAIPTVSANANYANFAGEAFNVNASNITGTVANANYAANAGNATIANSANNVTLANVSGAGNIASINLDGNASNILFGNGVFASAPNTANANYANFAGTAFNVSGSNVSGEVANAAYANAANTANLATFATTANSVAGANVSGTVANATYAANAGHANTANTVTDNAQPNITSVGTLTGLDVNGNITANVITANTLVGNIALTQVNYIDFDTANGAPSFQTGRVYWDNVKDTLAIDMNAGGNITQQVGEDQYIFIKANATISSGQVVMFNGVVGDTILGAPANTASAGFIPRYVMGVAPANIASGANGYVQTVGEIYNLQTNAFPAGSILYLQSNSNGVMTITEPIAPDPKIVLAACLVQSSTPMATNGKIQVRPDFGYYMNQLHNVSNVTATTGDVLVYNSSNVYTPSNTVPVANLATYATTANSVAGANVSGEVANAAYANAANTANLATYATTANSVAGANVSGEVANANYASYANIANTANSVALANVVGIGNIANINLDGSSSNVLFGNGVFAPESTSIANANYANFAGNVINGTSNVSIPVANGNVNISTNGNANIAQFDTNGALFLYPTTSSINALRINSYGNPTAGDVNRIASFRARGNAAAPLSVQANDNLMRLLAFGYNGAGQQTNSTGSIRAQVDNSYTPNTANIPVGWNIQVNDTNGGTNNQSRTHNFWANGNVTFNNVIFADGGGLSNIVGANVTGQVSYAAVANSVAVANVSGIGNIATINLDGSSANVLYGNGVFAPTAGGGSNIANGTSNISIPVANGNIVFSTNGNANVVDVRAEGSLGIRPPAQGPLNAIRIETYGRPGNQGAQRISSFRYRGNTTTPLGVQPGDNTMEFLTAGSNGTALQTNSVASIRAQVDSSYTANTANIPIGWQVIVNDTNGGINNQSKTHQFYANGAVSLSGNLSANGGLVTLSNSSGGNSVVYVFGDKTSNSTFDLGDIQFSSTLNNVNTSTGFSAFRFQQYTSLSSAVGPWYAYRARGNDFSSQTSVNSGDQIWSLQFGVNSNNAYATAGSITSSVTYNDNAGNVGMGLDFNAIGSGTTGYNNGVINLYANNTSANNFQASNVAINSGGFMKLASYTAAALTAITGVVGQIATVTNSTPGGMMAYWDTTNTRWSYVHDNSAV